MKFVELREVKVTKLLIAILIVIIGISLYLYSSTQPITEATVIMLKDKFEPENLEIKKNTKVIFKNEDSIDHWPASNLHPTHGIYPEFDPQQPVKPGQSWEFVFDKVGFWKYHDHLTSSIRGTISVLK